MKINAIYPGTFDPITFGHIDVIKKALKIVDTVIVAISETDNKNYFFNAQERMDIVKKALFSDLKLNKKKIKIILFKSLTTDLCKKYKSNIQIVSFNSLTTNLCKKFNSKIILRGLRAVSDFEYEFQLAGMNKKLNKNIETIFLMSSERNSFISSNFIKEVHLLGGDISKFVSKYVFEQLNKKNK